MMITPKEFMAMDMRVAEIVTAEPVDGTDRLLKVNVDLGQEQRTLVAGLAAYYRPQELLGKKVIVVANMKPARIHGVLSEGMLLGAGCSSGTDVSLLTVDKAVDKGTRVE
ncbi:MAG: methionine--tRNA ligase subunit beta [Alphaproteobacteria bacterium]|nr:methionine--tRNA ligase subunit beta [Alphaproteobacteria bacterium]